MLRDAECQLAISPRPPDAGDVLQKRLFEDRYQVFYDANMLWHVRHPADPIHRRLRGEPEAVLAPAIAAAATPMAGRRGT